MTSDVTVPADAVVPVSGGIMLRVAGHRHSFRVGQAVPVHVDGVTLTGTVRSVEWEVGKVVVPSGDVYPGMLTVTVALPLPQVRGECRGRCKGTDRVTPPTRSGVSRSGIKGIFCDCCEQWLVPRGHPSAASLAARGSSLSPDALGVWACDNCGFDVWMVTT